MTEGVYNNKKELPANNLLCTKLKQGEFFY